MFDRPFVADWLFWLAVALGTGAAVWAAVGAGPGDGDARVLNALTAAATTVAGVGVAAGSVQEFRRGRAEGRRRR